MFKTESTVREDTAKHEMRVSGSEEKTSTTNNQAEAMDVMPVKVINEILLRRVNVASTFSLALVFLLNSLSFTQNWHQPLISVIAAIPIGIQTLVTIWMLLYGLFISKRPNARVTGSRVYWRSGAADGYAVPFFERK